MKTKRTNSAIDYLGYALYAFGGLGFELILLMLPETSDIIHWIITSIVWGSLGYLLYKRLPVVKKEIKILNWVVGAIIFLISVVYTSVVWNGCKTAIEFTNLGMPEFLVQYAYYACESLLVVLIIAHGQRAFELWFKGKAFIPFGGIVLAFTWGLVHILTQGGATGRYTFIQALLYGIIYVIFNRNFKVSYIAVTLMFML